VTILRHRSVARLLTAGPPGAPAVAALVVRVVAGVTIAAFGVGKFTRHAAEAAAFDTYGIPFPEPVTYLVGGLELAGGALLVLGCLTRPVALALAGNFVVAILTAGRIEGGPVHLIVAPALLACMLFLLWSGPGRVAVDRRPRRVTPDGSTSR
jgi:putative oxidoreductase